MYAARTLAFRRTVPRLAQSSAGTPEPPKPTKAVNTPLLLIGGAAALWATYTVVHNTAGSKDTRGSAVDEEKAITPGSKSSASPSGEK